MKRILAVVTCICLVFSLLLFNVVTVNAATEGDFTYVVSNGEATITGYSGNDSNVLIPSSFNNYIVTSIKDYAFYQNFKIESVTIPGSVKKIGSYAFRNCAYLKNVTFINGVVSIGEYAFNDCSRLETITIPPSLQKLANGVFKGCEISKVYITDLAAWCNIKFTGNISGDGPLSGGKGKLYLNNSLITKLIIPEGVTRIETDAFKGCDSITSVVLPKSLLSIGYNSFKNCSNIKDVWYVESESSKSNVSIDSSNSYIANATWHYDSCQVGAEHIYDTICDANCNVCGDVREVAVHSFTNYVSNKDATCQKSETETAKCDNQCGATDTREIENSIVACRFTTYISDHNATCKNDCTETAKCDYDCERIDTRGIKDSKLRHSYSNNCDTTCNVCSAKRTIKHTYTNACDTSCNVCEATRMITHSYKTTTTDATLSKSGKIVKKCTVCDKVASTTKISYPKTIKLSTTSYTYNGKAKKPSVTVKDVNGKKLTENKDYTVTYPSGRKNIGSYKVKVKFKGNYSGTEYLTFKINPKATKVSSVSAGKKSLKVKITKQSSQTTGYEVQYSTSKKFSSAKTKKVKTTSVTLKSLKAKKTYYVRVRTYKMVGKTKYYSAWSSYKYKKTK